jgi:LDH2 family malate/lactate/ureidoglycolate dehydrogenase
MLNGRGEPSTDPREYYTDPVGSLLTAGEHKGFGLSLVVEVLGGILSGTGPAQKEKGPVVNGTFMLCIDVARFVPLDEFHAKMRALVDWVRSAPLAAGSKEILIPGEPEARTMRERLASGVPVEDETWSELQACAAAKAVRAAGRPGAGAPPSETSI